MRKLVILSLAAALGACAGTALPQPIADGMPAAIGETVQVGNVLATPRAVTEDSRCPFNARCVWAGQLIVSTRLDGAGWTETVPLKLGEPYAVGGTTVTLVSGLPEKSAGRETPRSEYRFIFDGGA